MKKILLLLTLISVFLYTLTFRGSPGIPTPKEIETTLAKPGKSFETSQERSRYAIILSVANYGTINIDNYASIGTPDIGKINGHYYSFFPPAASIIALPFYYLGLLINAPQMTVFLVSTIFAFLTMVMIVVFTQKLKLHWTTSLFSAIAFGFATNAWGYSVTFYAHLISSFLILSAIFLATFINKKNVYINSILIWVLYSIAVYVDFPNLFLFLPIAIFTFSKAFEIKKIRQNLTVNINWILFFTPMIFGFLMFLYAFYNNYHFGDPTTLSNAIPRVRDLKVESLSIPESEKTAVGALNTRYLLEGLRTFIYSRDRGVLIFSPFVFLFLLSINYLRKKEKYNSILLLSVPAICLVLYSMFGDPYGGWAFGSRYMIAILPPLIILAAIALQNLWKKTYVKILYTLLFVYSAAVALLSPLTTNVIPPHIEARNIGLRSDYFTNIEMLSRNQLNSFLYNSFFKDFMTGNAYYIFILLIVASTGTTLIWMSKEKYAK